MTASLSALDITVIVLVALILLLLLYVVITVNSFKRLLIKVATAEDNIDKNLTEKYDLLTKAAVEYKDALELKENMTIEEKINFNNELDKLAGDLVQNQISNDLLKSVQETDKRLKAAIEDYNFYVTHFNNMLITFPANLIAGLIKLKPIKSFAILTK
ncbi:MAG TPA: LemA family protein [Clostridia bacterium]